MENKPLFILLNLVRRNGDARILLHEGVDFKAAGELLKIAFDKELLVNNKGQLKLTKKGEVLYSELNIRYGKKSKEDWIKPALKSQISKIDRNDIFLPSQDELTF